jgi:hypothetical protein
LVGIAGEDDIDAPDLKAPMPPASAAAKPAPKRHGRLNGGQNTPGPSVTKVVSNPAKLILGPKASATLRDQLLGELGDIASSDDAAVWAHRILGAKNSLNEVDARRVEDAFQAKLATLEDINGQPLSPAPSASRISPSGLARQPVGPAGTGLADGIDKSRLTLPEPRRFRDREHVKFVAKQACLICERRPADAHHLRFAQHRALGRKVSDEFTVPLCRGHHREAHRYGDEAAWWKNAGVDPTVTARALWLETHPLPTSADQMSIESATSLGAVGTEQNAKRGRPISKRGRNDKTKPIIACGPQ